MTSVIYLLLLTLVAIVVDGFVATSYYTWFDPGMGKIREKFSHMTATEAQGGILAERDHYLRSCHTIMFGTWTVSEDFDHDTQVIYIWWPV